MAQGFGQDIQRQSPRVSLLKRKLDGSEDADIIMMNILEVFKEVEYVPDPGNYYTFIYNAKTPNLLYDQHPLVAILEVNRWGVVGLNFHWVGLDGADIRNYTWPEVAGYFHKIDNDEIMSMRNINYAKFLRK